MMEGDIVIKVVMTGANGFRFVEQVKGFFIKRRKEIHYIGGTEVLPTPLSAEEERRIVARLGSERDRETKKVLIERNLRLVAHIAKKYATESNFDDLVSTGTIGLIKGINTFDPAKKIKLATYASRCIDNEILMYLRHTGKNRLEVSIDEPLNVDWDGNELLLSDILGTDEDIIYRDVENEAEIMLLRSAMEKLGDREREIVELRYGINQPGGKELTQKEVADRLGISQSYISRLEKKIMNRLKKEILKFECS